jgi:organic hydroperoxide reductase OsmC/OhrA
VQVARALHIEPTNVRINVTAKYSREGSILAGDAKTMCDSIKTELSLDSHEPPERVAQLIKMAEATCFTLAALRNRAPVELEATVNGMPFDPERAGSARSA